MQGISRIARCCWLASLLAGLVPAAALAAQPAAWFSRTWRSDEGLPDNQVQGVAQTPDGFLWVATQYGLVRFDGVRFTECRAAETKVAPGVRTLRMLADRRGRLWLGQVGIHGGGSLVCVETGRTRVFTPEDGLPDAAVMELAEDGEGAMWSVSPGSLTRICDGEVRELSTAEGPPGGGSCRLTVDGRGQLWFAKSDNLGVFRDGRFRTLLTLQGPVTVTALTGARGGGVWFAQGTHVLKYAGEGEPQDFGELAAKRPAEQPTILFEDRTGGLWAGTFTEGLFRLDGPGFTRIELPLSKIVSMTDDREGNIWVGTDGGGLHRLHPRAFDLQEVVGGASDDPPVSVCQDAAGIQWAATKSGLLARSEGMRWKTLSAADGWPVRGASCVTPAVGGGVWVGTQSNGLYLWRDGVGGHFTKENGLAGNMVTALLTTSAGDVWLATVNANAVQRMRDGRFQTFTLADKYGPFGTLAEDTAGVVWVATSGGLLSQVSGDKLVDETANTLGTHHTISALCTTADGSLWIGYMGRGVGRLKHGRFSRFDKEQGLMDNSIYQVVPDGRGRIWLAANRGLFSVAEKEFEAVVEGRQTQVHPVYYGREEGLSVLQPKRSNWPSSWRSADDRLWLPMADGLVVVDPGRLTADPEPPPVVIERVTADGRTAAIWEFGQAPGAGQSSPPLDLRQAAAHLVLPPGTRQIEFDYTGLGFASSHNVAFRYRMADWDRNWVEAGPRRGAYYNHLPPGNYHFQVIARTADGVWSPQGATLAVTVRPYFWQTWWFVAVCFAAGSLTLMGTGWGIARRRARRKLAKMAEAQALERERSRIARDIHDDLGAGLTQISLVSALAREDAADAGKSRAAGLKVEELSRDLVRSLDEIVWAVRPQHDNLNSVVDYLGFAARDLCEGSGVRCWFTGLPTVPALEVSASVRHNLLLACREAINNVLKHSGANEVRISLRLEAGDFTVEIADNGHGFDVVAGEAKRSGLLHIRQRLGEVGGRCAIDSVSGQGTTVRLTLPLDPAGRTLSTD